MKFLLQLIVVNCFIFSLAFAGTEINNGGAGISINGKVATFYSAEMEVNPTPLETTLVMIRTGNLVSSLDLPNRVGMELVENILPSFDRKYYAVTEESIDQSTLKIIKEQYGKITNESVENITIFALTDPAKKITLLLPDYFKLTESEQMAILFHESLWINERVKSYENMMEIERDTQIFAAYPEDCIPRYNLTKKIENIFHEKLWALNSIFKCQTQKYFSYTSSREIPFNDFASRAETNTLAKILLRSYFKMPADNQLYDLFINQINTNPNYKIFLASKTALIEALKDGSINLNPIFFGNPLEFDSTPLSQKNIDLLVQNLSTADMAYGFKEFDLFRIIITNRFTSSHLRIEMSYESIDKGHNKIAE
jgi:hypothetical protein